MNKKISALIVCFVVCVSMFSMFSMIPTVKAVVLPESDLYYWSSQLSVKVYRWIGGQWVFSETRDFKYNTNWYAKKFLFNSGNVESAAMKMCRATWWNMYYSGLFYVATPVISSHLVIGMEDDYYGGDCAYDDFILVMSGSRADNGKYQIFIDCLMTGASSLKKEVFMAGERIFDYPTDKQRQGWVFVDTEFPEVFIQGGGVPYIESEKTYVTPISPYVTPCDIFASRLATDIYALSGGEYVYVAGRWYMQRKELNPNKWWVKWFNEFWRFTDTFIYQKITLGVENLWYSKALKDNFSDLVITATWFYDKITGLQTYIVEAVHTTGGLKMELYYWRSTQGWIQVYSGYPLRYVFNVICETWY